MICDIRTSLLGNPIFLPLYPNDAQDLYDMLNKSFPYRKETYHLNLWDFSVCCAAGYDNGVIFNDMSSIERN